MIVHEGGTRTSGYNLDTSNDSEFRSSAGGNCRSRRRMFGFLSICLSTRTQCEIVRSGLDHGAGFALGSEAGRRGLAGSSRRVSSEGRESRIDGRSACGDDLNAGALGRVALWSDSGGPLFQSEYGNTGTKGRVRVTGHRVYGDRWKGDRQGSTDWFTGGSGRSSTRVGRPENRRSGAREHHRKDLRFEGRARRTAGAE